jgi:L-lactate dehydrogenase complex protein LldF
VITPNLKEVSEWKHLSYASSLCGNCTEVCPVRINLHELLLENRYTSVASGSSSLGERLAWKMWRRASMSRTAMNLATGKMKNFMVNSLFKSWTHLRGELSFAPKTFNQAYREKMQAREKEAK